MHLTDAQKVIIQTAVDQLHDRLLRTRVDIAEHEPGELVDLDEYIGEVRSLLALFS